MKLTGSVPLFQVFDMPTAVAFYRDVLGFSLHGHSDEIDAPEGRYFHWCWLRSGGAELMLNTAYDAGERPPSREEARWAAHADAGLSIGCDDVEAVYRHLKARGVDCEPPQVVDYGMKNLFVRDPDGYGLLFQQNA
jgi:catechol 2,3-dioxygenase-like lactoylglutathione lyase family enzyme